MTEDDWDDLRRHAMEAAIHAYAPYSGLHVGAAARTTDGRLVTGCDSIEITECQDAGSRSQFN